VYKTLCITVLLVGTLALTGRNSAATPTALPSPVIVAKAALVDQTAPLPTTTIFTAPHDGLYQLTIYASITTADPNSGSSWNFNLSYTDLGATNSWTPWCFGKANTAGFFRNGFPASLALQVKAGTSVTYSVTQNGAADNSAYSLFYTVERLE
jgi:hypothetical protein